MVDSKKTQLSEYIHFVPYVNCPDLLKKAVMSTLDVANMGRGIIIDNRNDMSLPSPIEIIGEGNSDFEVFVPDVPLTTAQTMNLMKKISNLNGCKFFTWIHGDGEIVSGSGIGLIEEARRRLLDNEKWGVLFTFYDVFCAFNMEACNVAGEWDWLRFPFYHLDVDYFHRLRAAGYACINYGHHHQMEIAHHNNASNTIKNDAVRQTVAAHMSDVSAKLLSVKYPNENIIK